MQTIEYQPGDKVALQKAIERTNCLLLTDVTELTNMTELRQRNRIRPIIEGLEAIGRADVGMSGKLEAICGSVRPAPTAPRGEKDKGQNRQDR